jgi:hypothetical protein
MARLQTHGLFFSASVNLFEAASDSSKATCDFPDREWIAKTIRRIATARGDANAGQCQVLTRSGQGVDREKTRLRRNDSWAIPMAQPGDRPKAPRGILTVVATCRTAGHHAGNTCDSPSRTASRAREVTALQAGGKVDRMRGVIHPRRMSIRSNSSWRPGDVRMRPGARRCAASQRSRTAARSAVGSLAAEGFRGAVCPADREEFQDDDPPKLSVSGLPWWSRRPRCCGPAPYYESHAFGSFWG